MFLTERQFLHGESRVPMVGSGLGVGNDEAILISGHVIPLFASILGLPGY